MGDEGNYTEEKVNLEEDNCLEELVGDIEELLESDKEDVVEVANIDEAAPDEFLNEEGNGNFTNFDVVKDELKASDQNSEEYAALLAYPPHSCEIFVAGLPKHVSEMDLDKLCESIGEIVEVRLVRNKDTGEAKGYAFVSFTKKEDAKKAIEHLHNQEFMGRTLRCSLSESKYKLFIGNIPKRLTDDEFSRFIEEIGPGIEIIDLVKDPQKPGCNRGFGFVEYYNNACAEYAKQKMSSADFRLDGNILSVSWADNRSMNDCSGAAQVKTLYVKNIPDDSTTEQLKELFERHGEVIKVVMPQPKSGDNNKRNFGFVYYAERSSALKALNESETYEIKGKLLEVMFARPQSDRKPNGQVLYGARYSSHRNNSATNCSVGSDYYTSSEYHKPMIYARGGLSAGMQMAPMVLPDGQIAYVLQAGARIPNQRRSPRYDHHAGSHRRRSRDRGNDDDDYDGRRSRRRRPY